MDDFEMIPGPTITEYKNTESLDTVFIIGIIALQLLYVVCVFTRMMRPISDYSECLTNKEEGSKV